MRLPGTDDVGFSFGGIVSCFRRSSSKEVNLLHSFRSIVGCGWAYGRSSAQALISGQSAYRFQHRSAHLGSRTSAVRYPKKHRKSLPSTIPRSLSFGPSERQIRAVGFNPRSAKAFREPTTQNAPPWWPAHGGWGAVTGSHSVLPEKCSPLATTSTTWRWLEGVLRVTSDEHRSPWNYQEAVCRGSN